ncbi:MAG: hypothetical protein ABI723_17015 [Bacteroidia bacterium]
MEGIIGITPTIKKISFLSSGKMQIILNDGREVATPLSFFPSIKKLDVTSRKKWYVMNGNLFSFDGCNEIFHIEQVLGKESDYAYLKSQPKIKRKLVVESK